MVEIARVVEELGVFVFAWQGRSTSAPADVARCFEHASGIDIVRLPDLAAALECTVTYLLGLTTDPTPGSPTGAAPCRQPIPSANGSDSGF